MWSLTELRMQMFRSLSGGTSGKEPTCQLRRHKKSGFDPWVRKSPWRRYRNPLQYSCRENPMDRGVWQATVCKQLDATETV